jgi:DNA repair protein RadD
MSLRWYQQEAVDASMQWVKTCIDPALIIAATGAGKSHIIAAIAEQIHAMSGKKILCLAPSGELVEQNYAKYKATGALASIYSASLGKKDMKHSVVFGTPQTIANALRKFDSRFAAVIVDEAHGITPTLRRIIEHMRSQNPLLRVIGLSATPYRLGSGYIYQHHHKDGFREDSIEPFFHTAIYEIGARALIAEGFLTPPVFDTVADHYDALGLTINARGQFDAGQVETAFVGQGRKTSGIVADIVSKSRDRKGVMIFAATIQHAKEVLQSLPYGAKLVTGETDKDERRKILDDFKALEFKYLVNVAVLTTGFDASHVDVIAIMRATESVGLLQQIIGRGLRLGDDKRDCLVLDYGENIERHCPGGDIFDPVITAKIAKEGGDKLSACCPDCGYDNQFSLRDDLVGFGIDDQGYQIDMGGIRLTNEHGQPLPAHYGRRCLGEAIIAGIHSRCNYRWTCKVCEVCETENDIAARYCSSCKAEIIDPNEKLKELAAKIANDPYRLRTSKVLGWTMARHVSMGDKPDTLKVVYDIAEKPFKLTQWHSLESGSHWSRSRADAFCRAAWGETMPDIQSALDAFPDSQIPAGIAYRKKAGSQFFDVISVGNYE